MKMWSEKIFLIIGCILHSHSVLAQWPLCLEDVDCSTTAGALCSEGACVCPAGQQLVLGGSRCADASPYYTSSCYEDHQCSNLVTNFACRTSDDSQEGSCFCQPGFHYFRGRCWQSADHGEACNRDEECMGILRDPYSLTCQQGTCACADGYYERQRGECRKIGFAVGDGCVLDEDCQFTNGVCEADSFTCNTPETTSTISTFTDRVANNATGRTLTRQQGTPCDSAHPCASPFVCSSFGTCVCPTGYYPSANGGACLAELGSPSTADQCVGFLAEVIDGVCTCPPNIYFEENMRDCVKATIRLNDACISDEMCHTFGAASRCTDPQPPWGLRNCECIPELAVWDEARTMCRLFVGVGEYCEVDSDCLAGEMEINCVPNEQGQGVCTCPDGFVNVDGLCLTSGLQLGDSCQATQECTETANTVCEGGRCSCGQDYQEIDGFCAPIIGGTCTIDSDCTIANTVCVATNTSSTCKCADNFVEYNQLCWPALSAVTTECNVTAQCTVLLGDASQCANSQCQCQDQYHLRDGGCWPQIGLFGTCSRNSECYLSDISERVVCRNSLCQCSFDYPYSEELDTCTSSASMAASSIVTMILALYYLMLC